MLRILSVASRKAAITSRDGMSAFRAIGRQDRVFAREHLGLQRVDALARRCRNLRGECWVEHERDDVTRFTHLKHSRLEGAALDVLGDGQQGEWEIDHDTAECDLRGAGILVGIRANDERILALACRLEHAKSSGIGVLKNDVDTARELGECLLLSGADVIPVPDVRRDDADRRIDGVRSFLERAKAFDHWRKFGSSNGAQLVRFRHRRREYSREVGRVGEPELDASDIWRWLSARSDQIDGLGKLGGDSLGRVLVLEAMANDQVVSLRPVLSEVVVELRGSLRLYVADRCAEAIANLLEATVGSCVPGLIGDRSWCEESNLESGF